MKNQSNQAQNHKNIPREFSYFYSFVNSTPDQYYAMPKFLFENKFSNLSIDAKILYTLMRDRVSYSIRNKWEDDDGRVYILFTMSETEKYLGISKNTAIKAHRQLVEAGLIEKVNVCGVKPLRIYVKDYVAE